MVGRRHAATAFRPSAPSTPVRAPSKRQTAALLVGVLAVATGISLASFVVKPNKARSFDLFYGSVYIDDNVSPVAIDLSSGKATVRLSDASSAVSADRSENLDVIPLDGGTLMLDPTTGAFNMLDSSGFVLKPTGGGVLLPQLPNSTDALTTAVPAGDSAYLVRSNASGTAVYLVGQSTVASAIGVTSGVKARAQATLKRTTADDDTVMTSANGQLYLLAGRVGTTRQLVRMSVPPGSNAGASMLVHSGAHVTGVAALASATVDADGSGGDAVGMASARSIRIISPDGSARTERLGAQEGVDAILPVSDAQGALVFLYHGQNGWSLVRAPISGGAPTVSRIAGIDAGIGLVSPVESNGQVYTIGRNTVGSLFDIDSSGKLRPIAGVEDGYPVKSGERLNLGGAEITAKGSRVIFDSRANLEAVVVFSDGSHAARKVFKHSAVQVDTNGSASVTGEDATQNPPKNQGPKSKPQAHPEQAVNNSINCKVASQTPHIPTVQLVQRAARSVQLQWQYPLLDPQDCDPSTYTVSVKALTSGVPAPPSTVTVQGQDGVNLTGLFPDTDYQIVVTAYINKLHTSSAPLKVRTSIEGPPAPTGVHTSVDNSGNWTVTWNSCGGLTANCVATADWQVIPHLCDGVGLSSAPDTRRRVGDPTQHTFSFTYRGSETLLGRGMSFDIQGIGEKGTIGDSASDGSCSYSWTPTVASDISVHPSAPPMTTGETTTHTNVTVQFKGGQQHDLGGVGGQLTYELLTGGSVVARIGPTTKSTISMPGIAAGRQYQVAVIANPARHPEASAHIGPVNVQPAIAVWPAVSVMASFGAMDAYTGTLHVSWDFPAITQRRNETFDLTDRSELVCSNTTMPLQNSNMTPGQNLSFDDVDRTQLNGPCQVYVQLVQNAGTVTNPPLYGDGTTSRYVHSPRFTIPVPTLTVEASDFDANWVSGNDPGHPQVAIRYTGSDDVFLAHAKDWQFQVLDEGSANFCGGSKTALDSGNRAVTVDVDRSCIKDGSAISATTHFSFYGASRTFDVTINGSAPTPVESSKISFTAEWAGGGLLSKRGVLVHYADNGTYSQSDIDALNWKFQVTSNGVTCAKEFRAPDVNGNGLESGLLGDNKIEVSFDNCPKKIDGAPQTYTVSITYDDPNYGSTPSFTPVTVEGSPSG